MSKKTQKTTMLEAQPRRRKNFAEENNDGFTMQNALISEATPTMLYQNPFELSSLDGTNGFQLNGINANDYSGLSLSRAGDVNQDGYADIIIGASYASADGRLWAGQSYVIFGQADFNKTVALSQLNGNDGFQINGIHANDRSGYSVSGAGDINGDGYADLIIGAYYASPDGRVGAGQSYVVFGQAHFNKTFELSQLNGTNGFQINGVNANDYTGRSVSGAGDVNKDGHDDLIIGAIHASPDGRLWAGKSYVVFGQARFNKTFELSQLNGANGFQINGMKASDLLGGSVSGAGDVNKDGYADVIIGAICASPNSRQNAGETFVVFGRSHFEKTLELSQLNGANGFQINGITANDFSGVSVSGAGDVNQDGYADLIIGAYQGSPNGQIVAGESYVIFGQASFAKTFQLSSLNGANGFQINGIAALDRSGRSVGGAGDINGDGYADLIIGAYGADSFAGESYVVFGKAHFEKTFELSQLNGANGFQINGMTERDFSGMSVSGAGDINQDGYVDLLIGAPYASPKGCSYAGESYVILGGQGLFVPTPSPSQAPTPSPTPIVLNRDIDLSTLTHDGQGYLLLNGGGQTGYSVSGAGDVNRDGKDDFIVGAPASRGYAGEAYVVYGGNKTDVDLSRLSANRAGFSLKYGVGQTGYSVSGAGDVNGDGKADLIVGAPFANQGQAYVVYGGNGTDVDLSRLSQDNQGFILQNATGFVGYSVSGVGDVNRDGKDDLIVGAPGANDNNGQAYVVYGGSKQGDVDLSTLSINKQGFALIHGIGQTGWSVAGAGDVNGDGKADMIVGAPFANDKNGQAYVVYGGFEGDIDLSTLAGRGQGFVLRNGIGNTGYSVSGAGDVNGDGRDDVIVGAPWSNGEAGQAYVVYGGIAGNVDLSKLNTNNEGFVLTHGEGRTGFSVSSAGDINRDGRDDLLVGAPMVNEENGLAYVVYGGGKGDVDLSTLDEEGRGFLLKDGRGQTGYAVAGAGDVNGDGGADMIVGAPRANSQTGRAYVVYGQSVLSQVRQYRGSFWKGLRKQGMRDGREDVMKLESGMYGMEYVTPIETRTESKRSLGFFDPKAIFGGVQAQRLAAQANPLQQLRP